MTYDAAMAIIVRNIVQRASEAQASRETARAAESAPMASLYSLQAEQVLKRARMLRARYDAIVALRLTDPARATRMANNATRCLI